MPVSGFLQWVTGRQHRVVVLVAAFTLMPFLGVISGGLLAVQALRLGRQAIVSAVLAGVLLSAVALASGSSPGPMLAASAMLWGPVLALALLLRSSGSLTLCFQLSAVFGLAAIVVGLLLVPDPVAAFREMLGPMQAQLQISGQELTPKEWDMVYRAMPGVMTGLMILTHLSCLFLGRVWQDMLEGSRGRFGGEFRQLKMGTVLIALASVVILLAVLTGGLWANNMIWVFVVLLTLQGLSLAHFMAASGWPPATLYIVYGLLVLLVQVMLPILAAVGFLDNWFNLRRFLARRGK